MKSLQGNRAKLLFQVDHQIKKGLKMPAPEPTSFWRGLIKLLVMKLILLSEGIKSCSTS